MRLYQQNTDVIIYDTLGHYQYYSVLIDDVCTWPFSSLHRFMIYLYDFDERRRIQSQCSIYIKQDLVTARMTVGDMRAMASNENNPSLFACK